MLVQNNNLYLGLGQQKAVNFGIQSDKNHTKFLLDHPEVNSNLNSKKFMWPKILRVRRQQVQAEEGLGIRRVCDVIAWGEISIALPTEYSVLGGEISILYLLSIVYWGWDQYSYTEYSEVGGEISIFYLLSIV